MRGQYQLYEPLLDIFFSIQGCVLLNCFNFHRNKLFLSVCSRLLLLRLQAMFLKNKRRKNYEVVCCISMYEYIWEVWDGFRPTCARRLSPKSKDIRLDSAHRALHLLNFPLFCPPSKSHNPVDSVELST